MSLQTIDTAVKRVKSALQRRPELGVHDDTPATATWVSGARVTAGNAKGVHVTTDMPLEMGGLGEHVTPGWLFRAGLGTCAATSITLAAATQGIELAALSVEVASRSDVRGLLGMAEPDAQPVYAGPFDVELRVTIAAVDASPDVLRALVAACLRHSPVPSALTSPTPFALQVNVEPA